jgi:hypothetical protein
MSFTSEKNMAKNCPLNVMIEINDNPQFFFYCCRRTIDIAIINSLEKFVQLDDYLQFGVKPSEQDFEKILENLHLDSEEISPLNKCIDA